jgi:hypothetical protein
VGPLHRIGRRQAGELATVGDEGHSVHAGDVRVALRHVADPRANLDGRLGNVQAQHPHPTLFRLDESEQGPDHRALAGAVRSEQADRAGRKDRGHRFERELRPVANAHVVEDDPTPAAD